MKPRIMIMEEDWERIKKEELSYLEEQEETNAKNAIMLAGGGDKMENRLRALVQQATRN